MTDLVANDTAPRLKLEEFLPYRLAILSSAVSNALMQVNAHHDFSVGEWLVLMSLGELGPMTSKGLGTRNYMHKTKISRIVAALLQRGLILRKPNLTDRREAFLLLTSDGEGVYDECAPRAADFVRRLEDAIPLADRAALNRCLTGLAVRSEQLIAGR